MWSCPYRYGYYVENGTGIAKDLALPTEFTQIPMDAGILMSHLMDIF
jgi:hypothetical protein